MNALNHVRANGTFSDDLLVQIVLLRGSVLSPLLFKIKLEIFLREMRPGCLVDLLYTYNLVLVTETLLKEKLELRQRFLRSKELQVDVKKAKLVISSNKA